VQRPQQLAMMFLLGAFLVGGTLGFAADRVVGDRWGTAGRSTLDAFAEELSLSAAQRASVDSILDERHRIIDSIITPVRPSIEAARESARRQIAQRLTPDQQTKYAAYLERMRQEAAAHK